MAPIKLVIICCQVGLEWLDREMQDEKDLLGRRGRGDMSTRLEAKGAQ